jgi:hypothetical protein
VNPDRNAPNERDNLFIGQGHDVSPKPPESRNAADSKFTRREFVSIVGAVTGGIALRIPNGNAIEISYP